MARAKKAPQHVEPEDESQSIAGLEAQEPGEDERPKVSETDAIRAALAEGAESPEGGTDFIRKRFGIEISKSHFSGKKSQIKKKDTAASRRGRERPGPRRHRSRNRPAYRLPVPRRHRQPSLRTP